MAATTFTLPFLERLAELQALAKFYDRGGIRDAGFLLLYGRKGVGKTRLLQHFLLTYEVADYFYWTAPPGDAAAQLRDFSQALLRYAPNADYTLSADFSFYNWREALDYLAQIAAEESRIKLFILEGFTDLCHNLMSLSSYFQHAWDGRLKDISNLRLIITGAHISTMIREVLAYSAPLYFRANANLLLQPLRYTAIMDLFPDYSAEERLAIYAITGGIPAYLTYFARTLDMPTAIEELCFAPDSSFIADMETLFDERFEDPVLCQAILTAVANGYHDPNRLSHRLDRPDDDLQHHLVFLRLVKLLAEERSVHIPRAGIWVRYTLAEPSLSFYYQPLQPLLGKQSPKNTAAAVYGHLHESLGQEPFIALCREWVWAAVVTKQLDMLPRQVGAYWHEQAQTPEFTLAAADFWQNHLLVGEPFWDNGRLTPAGLKSMVHYSQQLPLVQEEGWTVEQVVFGRRPFTEQINQAAKTMGVRLVTLDEIEPLLLKARARRRWERDNPQPFEIEF